MLTCHKQANASLKNPQEICAAFGEVAKDGQLIQAINDVSLLNDTLVSCVIAATSTAQVSQIVHSVNEWNKTHAHIHISVSGMRHSQGGHIASKAGITLDMRQLNTVYQPKNNNGYWTVAAEAGALWSDVHQAIYQYDGHSFVNKVQQSSTPFTVGGTLSVNAHGRSFSYGSVIHSVQDITIVLPDGTVTMASRTKNVDLFKQAIGGYGLFGVITNTTLELHDNHYLQPQATNFATPTQYVDVLMHTLNEAPRHTLMRNNAGEIEHVRASPIAFLFATLDLDKKGFMTTGIAYTYQDLEAIDKSGLVNLDPNPTIFHLRAWITKVGFWLKRQGLLVRFSQFVQHQFLKNQDTHLKLLTPPIKPILAAANRSSPDLLQEYFIPVDKMPIFLAEVKEIFAHNEALLSNAALRFVPKTDESSLLTYESQTEDQLAVVLYFSLALDKDNIAAAENWTQVLVDKSLALGGRYYLPYQQWPTKQQFRQAYPNYQLFIARKKLADPNEVFFNKFYQYYMHTDLE